MTDSETIRSKKKVSLLSTFQVGSGIWDENFLIRIRHDKMFESGSWIKHPGSATLPQLYKLMVHKKL
jgi:hypothetical protein